MIRGNSKILIGDNRKTLMEIEPGTISCCVTSPPYFSLRSYLPKDHPDKPLELGSEKTIEEYIAAQLEVFRLVRTALHPTGTLWVNLGDGYANDSKWGGRTGGKHVKALHGEAIGRNKNVTGLSAGDQMLVPFRFALAMQADGWTLRDTIIYCKPSPMPISVAGWRWVRCRVKVASFWTAENPHPSHHGNGKGGDPAMSGHAGMGAAVATWQPCPGCPKCTPNQGYVLRRGKWRTTTSFEYLFMFAKGPRYFCDGDAVQEEGANTCTGRTRGDKGGILERDSQVRANGSFRTESLTETRNPRSVWTIASEASSEKHFAMFPSELVRRILLAATSAAGCCPQCRTPYAPVVESERVPTRPGTTSKIHRTALYPTDHPNQRHSGDVCGNRDPQRHVAVSRITGYRASCSCEAGEPIPCIVLDPYAGSFTTIQTAVWYGRDAIGCELSEEYAKIGERRIKKMPRCMMREKKKMGELIPDLEADEGLFAGLR